MRLPQHAHDLSAQLGPLAPERRWIIAGGAVLTLLFLGYFMFGNESSVAAMSVFHIVAFKLARTSDLPDLTARFLQLQASCQLDGRPYIRSLRGGKQTSPEKLDGGMQVVFLAEFANQQELEYYVFRDPVHEAFKKGLEDLGVESVTVLDFTDGVWPQ
ncbi:hypothetical protein A1Q1_04536 [Trichosporon asahii var. asahii CBS 2479]|uniref:Stress-response A/B barrel domain-containing protein n=1 Tax=Trichosporon asahii var. asahii (strain ATCC 90039 / CBS 2479 / JCM 2466 / KCTC 7840 / NBRC 103889/ NCYC 2677 / UAMH 7654) TaxID=1186058 RepID=J4UKC7_TRIAS|nr:hypothetical protein A1Q1_04536 [Trichosporon asahii var. asahii CBS 2479]EJT52325.1 hypothetical protein A1Q1_04536 [Trichosporon asahii var. asahii CBS 2479]